MSRTFLFGRLSPKMPPTIIGVVLKCFLLSITIFSNFIFILIVVFILDVTGIRTIRQGIALVV